MTTPHERRQDALAAIAKVLGGVAAASAETERVDFKVEHGSFGRDGTYRAIDPHDESAAKAMAIEASCFAHSDDGGVLVVGVNDKGAGPDAFVGTSLDTDWLRQRILDVSGKKLHVAEIEIIHDASTAGKRIYLIDVSFHMEEIRIDNKLHGRKGRDCVEVTGDDARRLLEHRNRHDWSAQAAGQRASLVDRQALEVARRLYAETQARPAPASSVEFLRQLGVLWNAEEDPQLNRAGALLFCAYEPSVIRLRLTHEPTEGVQSVARRESAAPVLVGFDEAWSFIADRFPARPVMRAAVRRELRDIPELALREALVNAIAHRDHDLVRDPILIRVIGDPARTLKVDSPGGFPPGVRADRLLPANRPRNPVLFHAMRTLGLGDNEGVGIDTMYRLLLRDGHPAPEIVEAGIGVTCRLGGGPVDAIIRAFFDDLEQEDRLLAQDVRATIAIAQLLKERYLTADELAMSGQCSLADAHDVLARLDLLRVTEPTPRYPARHRLTARAQRALAGRIPYRSRLDPAERWTQVEQYLAERGTIDAAELQRSAAISRMSASRLLRQYVQEGKLLVSRQGRYPSYALRRTRSAPRRPARGRTRGHAR